MSGDSSQDKQLPATAQRLKKARDEGQVVRSRDLGHFAVVAVSLGVRLWANTSTGCTHSHHFSMCRRIMIHNRLVPAFANNFTVDNHNCAD
ncbi:MAG: EscU/YscU/HrcU family type III secretion system export apparatus switch protein, partial [Sphaerotilus sp.]|nr:EscU/YscU/HrcU family type III secretion system export apparatus switch protein [Sphaerotilus sp.]